MSDGTALFLALVAALWHIFVEVDDECLLSCARWTVPWILGGVPSVGLGVAAADCRRGREILARIAEGTRCLRSAEVLLLQVDATVPS